MKKLLTAAALCILASGATAKAADAEKAMADVSAKTKNALAILTYTIKMETGNQSVGGQAMCVDRAGVFMTTYMDPSLRAENVQDVVLMLPGAEGKKIKAKFLGVDPGSGLGFVQAEEKYDWTPIEFPEQAGLTPGQMVISVGIMGGDGNRTAYMGVAHVSAVLRVPGPVVYVTGGSLTNICSPVFAADGKPVGIVQQQLPLMYQTDTNRGAANVPLRGAEETRFFTPCEEFASVLKSIPKSGEVRRLPWIGVNKFEAVTEDNAKLKGVELPAIMVDQVIPNQPAQLAGLKDTDIILAVNGQKLEKLANPGFAVQNFMRALMKFPIGQKITLKVLSGTTTKDVVVTVGPMPTLPNEANRLFDATLGMIVREKVMLDQYLGADAMKNVDGLIVIGIGQKSPAETYGLAGGDVITHVNDQPVRTRDEYKAIAEPIEQRRDPLKITYQRGNQPVSVTIQLPRQP